VVFQPCAAAIHYEFGSSGTDKAMALQREHRQLFVQKWGEELTHFELPDPSHILSAREHKSDTKRILFIDDRIPDYRIGHGYPRTYRMLELLAEMGYKLTFLPLQLPTLVPDIAQPLQMLGIEVFYKKTDQNPELEFLYDDPNRKINIQAFLASRSDYYDVVFVSRPHNMQEIAKYLKTYARRATIVYDAEALFSLRDLKYRELNGEHIPEAEKDNLIKAEVALIKDAQVVTTVSELEKEQFLKYGVPSVHVLGHIIEPKPTPASFEERKDILFIGSILFDPSPNGDAIRYFVNQILPLVREKVNCELYIAGTNRIQSIWKMESKYVHVVGQVEDLTSYYNRSRLFVVPTRFSAGIPLKLLEAAAHGLPAVVTPLTAHQLGWRENRDLLVGHNPEDFAKKVVNLYNNKDLFDLLRQNALDRIRLDYSPTFFRKTLENILNLTIDNRQEMKRPDPSQKYLF
jgi:O-antigen biosynthesis protein